MKESTLKYVYNLGIAEELGNYSNDKEAYSAKLKSNKAILKNLKLYKKEIGYLDSFARTSEHNLYSQKDLLLGVLYSFLLRNVQARNKQLNSLTGYGNVLNLVRKNLYANQNTENGYVGTLAFYYPNELSQYSELDLIEATLDNYWKKISIDFYNNNPNDRYKQVLELLELNLDFNELQISVYELFIQQDIKKLAAKKLIDRKDYSNLKLRYLNLELDKDLLKFLNNEIVKNYLPHDFTKTTENLIKYHPIGGMPLTYLSYIVEGIYLAVRYLDSLPYEVKQLKYSDFIQSSYIDYRDTLAKYITLAFDGMDKLRYNFEDSAIWRYTLFTEVQKLMVNNIASEGDYRINE